MEKNQYELCAEILKKLSQAGVLNKVIIIGSWCVYFYKDYFDNITYVPSIRTRDIDFLVPTPLKMKRKVDIPLLLKPMGFIIGFKGPKGYIKLEHPQLVIEFLVPEKGKGSDKPYPLPQLGINAQALRFLNFLLNDTIRIKTENFFITVPHPANFALHKLILYQIRKNPDKVIKDRDTAVVILKALINKGESHIIKHSYGLIPPKWKKRILKGLEKAKEADIAAILLEGN